VTAFWRGFSLPIFLLKLDFDFLRGQTRLAGSFKNEICLKGKK